jgi:hypothetical protein
VVCFNSNRILQHAPIVSIAPREWMNMPPLDFLPPDVDDIIAGAAGLLIVNGGRQPPCRNPPPPLEDFPEQSILVACNPLQRDYHVLPRMAHFKMHHKTARMVLAEAEAPEVGDWRSRLQPNGRHPDYRLYVLGGEKVESGALEADTEETALFTYDSRVDAWVCCSSQRDARLGRTEIAVVGDGLFFGADGPLRAPAGRQGREHLGEQNLLHRNLARAVEPDQLRHPGLRQPRPNPRLPSAASNAMSSGGNNLHRHSAVEKP